MGIRGQDQRREQGALTDKAVLRISDDGTERNVTRGWSYSSNNILQFDTLGVVAVHQFMQSEP